MVISSIVVETVQDKVKQVAEKLGECEGVEVHHVEGYKIIITVEAETLDASYDLTKDFIQITGVLAVNLIYCNFEDDPKLENKVV